jgi:hypothetical protein
VPVLVEAISVVVRRDAIDQRFPGGWQGFLSIVPNKTLCMDSQLARVGFMNPIDSRGFLEKLRTRGLIVLNAEGTFEDLVVIDQLTGPTATCTWVEILSLAFETGRINIARLKGNTENSVVFPGGWSFENSLSREIKRCTNVEPENHDFVRTENNVDVYRDRATGVEVYIGRTTQP